MNAIIRQSIVQMSVRKTATVVATVALTIVSLGLLAGLSPASAQSTNSTDAVAVDDHFAGWFASPWSTDWRVGSVTINGIGFDPLANDIGVDGLTVDDVEIIQQPSKGTLFVDHKFSSLIKFADSDARESPFIYMPRSGFVGQDQIQYRVTTVAGEVLEATVTFDIGRGGNANEVKATKKQHEVATYTYTPVTIDVADIASATFSGDLLVTGFAGATGGTPIIPVGAWPTIPLPAEKFTFTPNIVEGTASFYVGLVEKDSGAHHSVAITVNVLPQTPCLGKISADDCAALIALKSAADVGSKTWRVENFPKNGDLCNWINTGDGNRVAKCSNGRVTELNAGDLGLYSLPTEVYDLTEVVKVNLLENEFTRLESGIGNWSKLEHLDLRFGVLKTLPPDFADLSSLTYLDVGFNRSLTSMEEIASLTSLVYLDLSSNNRIKVIPDKFGEMVNLEQLEMVGTGISAIPDSIKNLQNLTYLGIDVNPVSSLPDSVGDLTSLRELSIEGSDIAQGGDISGWVRGFASRNQKVQISFLYSMADQCVTVNGDPDLEAWLNRNYRYGNKWRCA